MTIKEIQRVLDATLFYGKDEHLNQEASTVFASDMMSDVLAFGDEHTILVTGLCNPQVVRTAEIMDICCIIQVNGKLPNHSIYDLSKEREIVVLCTKHTMFTACGLLYEMGLRGN